LKTIDAHNKLKAVKDALKREVLPEAHRGVENRI
jgi:hypothetical protein